MRVAMAKISIEAIDFEQVWIKWCATSKIWDMVSPRNLARVSNLWLGSMLSRLAHPCTPFHSNL